ncbi:MAG TPA: cytidylate kinase-like family protein [Candidatus Saccharimonadia bacterium]|nr:cytidylate kinase-like family protein [Candidatus Saccharimonadia bacterium]
MPVITLSRQFGAGGAPIGRTLAGRFSVPFLDREIVAAAAERAGIPESDAEGYDERMPGLWQRLATAFSTSAPEVAVPAAALETTVSPAIGERLFALTQSIIEEAAAGGGVVILGRGAGFILAGRPDVLRVHLHASIVDRLRYLTSRVEDLPADARPDEASLRDLCRSVDSARATYLRRRFDVDWMDARNYDLALDTGRLGLARSIEIIESAARHLGVSTATAHPA